MVGHAVQRRLGAQAFEAHLFEPGVHKRLPGSQPFLWILDDQLLDEIPASNQ